MNLEWGDDVVFEDDIGNTNSGDDVEVGEDARNDLIGDNADVGDAANIVDNTGNEGSTTPNGADNIGNEGSTTKTKTNDNEGRRPHRTPSYLNDYVTREVFSDEDF